MKRVSIEVAKAIKKAGYPQGMENIAYYNENGVLIKPFVFNGGGEIADAPTYIEVWLWLWREKKICLFNVGNINNKAMLDIVLDGVYQHTTTSHSDPEEATIEAIEYLVENDLIK